MPNEQEGYIAPHQDYGTQTERLARETEMLSKLYLTPSLEFLKRKGANLEGVVVVSKDFENTPVDKLDLDEYYVNPDHIKYIYWHPNDGTHQGIILAFDNKTDILIEGKSFKEILASMSHE